MSLEVKLVVVGGDVKTTELSLRLPATIGRGRGQSVVLPHPLVSRQHCELFEADGSLMVRDLGSLNGTFVNNQKVTESPLPSGELLTVGTVTFRAVYESDAASDGAAPSPRIGPSDKTIPATKAPTIKAAPKPVPAEANSDSEILEFTEGELPANSSAAALQPTERLQPPLADKPRANVNEPNGSPGEKKRSPSKPTTAEKAEDIAVDFPNEEDEEPASSSSDDDLNDFLKSLED